MAGGRLSRSAAATAIRCVSARSGQLPHRNRKLVRDQASCQAWVSKPSRAAWSTAATRTWCSSLNQARARSWPVMRSGVVPVAAGTGWIGSRTGLSDTVAAWAVCR